MVYLFLGILRCISICFPHKLLSSASHSEFVLYIIHALNIISYLILIFIILNFKSTISLHIEMICSSLLSSMTILLLSNSRYFLQITNALFSISCAYFLNMDDLSSYRGMKSSILFLYNSSFLDTLFYL